MKTALSADALHRIAKKIDRRVGGQPVEGPLFEHDCDACVYQHSEEREAGMMVDWYQCPAPESRDPETRKFMGSGIVARFGDDGPDYASTTVGAAVTPTELEREALSNPAFNLTPEDEEIIRSRETGAAQTF